MLKFTKMEMLVMLMPPHKENPETDENACCDVFEKRDPAFQHQASQGQGYANQNCAQGMRQGRQHRDDRGLPAVPIELPGYGYDRQPMVGQNGMQNTDDQYADKKFQRIGDHLDAKGKRECGIT